MLEGRGSESGAARRREVTDLYATVLEVVKRYHGAARITRVSYGAGMPVDRLRTFVERLLALGLLRSEEVDGRPVYDVTPRGQEFLDTYWKMYGYLTTIVSYDSNSPSGGALRRPTPKRSSASQRPAVDGSIGVTEGS